MQQVVAEEKGRMMTVREKARRAYEMLTAGGAPETVARDCLYKDVEAMARGLKTMGYDWVLAEKAVEPEKASEAAKPEPEAQEEEAAERLSAEKARGALCDHAKITLANKVRIAQGLLAKDLDPESVARECGYSSASRMMAAIEVSGKMKGRMPKVNGGMQIKTDKPSIKFGPLKCSAVRGESFRFSLTEDEQDYPLPENHVRLELLQGTLAELIDEAVAGSFLPRDIVGSTYTKYAQVLRAAADEMDTAGKLFACGGK